MAKIKDKVKIQENLEKIQKETASRVHDYLATVQGRDGCTPEKIAEFRRRAVASLGLEAAEPKEDINVWEDIPDKPVDAQEA